MGALGVCGGGERGWQGGLLNSHGIRDLEGWWELRTLRLLAQSAADWTE